LFENSRFTVLLIIAMVAVASSSLAYLSWYVSPEEITEEVKIIANTADGCIAESFDGFSVNIGPCDAKAGDIILGTYDAKINERAILMNPTG
jgi:flagellar basal body-associated protein FliL